jgi:predicted NBD/HSP70 family sugar kinase
MGAGRGVDDLVLLTLGTGIGGGIISGGRVLQGYLGMAGELGHTTVVPDGNPCGCGNRGCLEKHASATAIAAMASMLHLGEGLSAREVYDLAMSGNEKASQIFLAMGQALGVALATLVNTFNFPLYLLSGGVLAAWDLFAPPMWMGIDIGTGGTRALVDDARRGPRGLHGGSRRDADGAPAVGRAAPRELVGRLPAWPSAACWREAGVPGARCAASAFPARCTAW